MVILALRARHLDLVRRTQSLSRWRDFRAARPVAEPGEALAQLIAEKDNPKTDIWFGGTGDPHLQAAEMGLSLEYKSPSLPQLQGWAQQQAKQAAEQPSTTDELQKLADMHKSGVLTDEEFAAMKKKLLGL